MPRAPLAAFRFPKRRRAMRRQLQPDAMRLHYFSQLRALLASAHALVTSELLPMVHAIREDVIHVDPLIGVRIDAAASSDEERVRARARQLAEQFAPAIAPNKLKPLAERVGQRTADFQKSQLQAQIKDVLTVNPFIHDEGLAVQLAEFTSANVSLIKSIPDQYFAEVEQVVGEGIKSGARATTIAQDLEERYQVGESRAALIADDQIGKFFGALNDTRQQELGITQATWNTAHDGRVRDSHRELDGQDYDLGVGLEDEDSGETVLPGQAIRCRCQGMPNLDALLGETAL